MTGQAAAPMAPEDVERARLRFLAWLRWYMAMYPEEAPNDAALARLIGVRKATVHYLLKRGSTRAPSFETLLGAKTLLGQSLDVMLFKDPPPLPPKRGHR